MYQQILDPVAHSLAWSSLVAALPLLLLFVMLGVLRVTAWVASLVSLALAIVLAILVYGCRSVRPCSPGRKAPPSGSSRSCGS